MQIFIKSLSNEEGIREWTMIELQGDLEDKGGDDLSGKVVGDLFYSEDGVATFVIGHHILVGKAEALEKPFAVLEKHSEDLAGGVTKTEYIVKALIKRKLIFKERPKPIVDNPLHK